MPYQFSAGVAVTERDLTAVAPAVTSSVGAVAGLFQWGPVMDPISINSEDNLVRRFGKPNDQTAAWFFTAANFLQYSNNCIVARADTAGSKNSAVSTSGSVNTILQSITGYGYTSVPAVSFASPGGSGSAATGTAVLGLANPSGTGLVVTPGTSSGFTMSVVSGASGVTGSGLSAATSITLAGTAAAINAIQPGQVLTAASGVAANTFVVSVVGNVLNISQALTANISSVALTFSTCNAIFSLTGYTTAPVLVGNSYNDGLGTVTTASLKGVYVVSGGSGFTTVPTITAAATGASYGTATITASLGVSSVVLTAPGTGYSSAPLITFTGGGSTLAANYTCTVLQSGVKIRNEDDYINAYQSATSSLYGTFAGKFPGSMGNGLIISMADSATYATWTYAGQFISAPGTSAYATQLGATNDEMHVIIIDGSGLFSGIKGTVLEKYAFVSKASDGRTSDGTNNHYKNVINSTSRYVWWLAHSTAVGAGTAIGQPMVVSGVASAFASLTAAQTYTLTGGVDDYNVTPGNLQAALALFANNERFDISLLMASKADASTAQFAIQNVAEIRTDCVAFISPQNVTTGGPIIGYDSAATTALLAFKALMPSSSYGVCDSGYKYQYDRYNDTYRWIPLNGDIAGLCARTDFTNDPWFSPGGYDRGQIKSVVKLAFNPPKSERDTLYINGINPVVTFPGQGTILYGDKTMLAKPSAFDRINVRRLFIVLEKSISQASKFQLFNQNDDFTRARFRSMVEPFLRDVQGRRGIIDYVVKCDTSNNTAELIDRNEFVADIYIKPTRSINYITLNFIAARSGISFSEIGA